MKDNFSKPVRLRVWGDYACFTRPETKVERVSYEVMTPSAARGILEAIFWKPEMLWQIDRIHVLKPIRHDSIRRNEVNGTASKGSGGIDISDSKNRAQRAALILRDVSYIIEARLRLTEKAGPEDTIKSLFLVMIWPHMSGAIRHFWILREVCRLGLSFLHRMQLPAIYGCLTGGEWRSARLKLLGGA